MKWMWVFVGLLILNGCAGAPAPSRGQDDGILLDLPYRIAFQKVQDLVAERGYTVAMADERSGIIETLPKRIEGEQGPLQHRTLLSFLIRGDRSQTMVYFRLVVTSDQPDEKEQILKSLKELSP